MRLTAKAEVGDLDYGSGEHRRDTGIDGIAARLQHASPRGD